MAQGMHGPAFECLDMVRAQPAPKIPQTATLAPLQFIPANKRLPLPLLHVHVDFHRSRRKEEFGRLWCSTPPIT